MKKLISAACLIVLVFQGMAQRRNPDRVNTYSDEENGGNGFRKENLFIGGSVNLGFSNYSFNAGAAPEIGYSLNRFVDVGALVNINYASERADPYYNDNIRTRSINYGVGAFGRFYPINFLFFQVEPEYNWTKYNFRNASSGETDQQSYQAASMLLGIGYGQRIVGRSNFYIAVMFDALSNFGSPYRDGNNAVIPVIKAGFDIYLHPRR
jgi:hypothetical protein